MAETIRKSYKYRIYPNKTVGLRIDETIETCRRVYNRLLEMHNKAYEEGRKLKRNDYYAAIIREPRKTDEFLQKVPAQVLNEVIERKRRNWSRYFEGLKKSNGNSSKPGRPRFKGRDFYSSFTYPQGPFKITEKRLLMSIGSVRIKLHRPIEGNIKTLTIKRKNGKYYALFSCEVEKPEPLAKTGRDVGVDVGILSFYATSDGDIVKPPRPYKEAETELKRLQRLLSRKTKGSSRRRKVKLLLAKAYEHVANVRQDFFYKEASKLLQQHDTIYVEDLDIREMAKRRRDGKRNRYTKGIHDVAWGTFLEILTEKATEKNKRVVAVDPKNTTQRCSQCYRIVAKSLWVRVHKCPYCGLEIDRDVNAARNILAKGRNDLPFGFVSMSDDAEKQGDRQSTEVMADAAD